jgi:lipoyl(octanoyl) transferase
MRIRNLGRRGYLPVWRAMQRFTRWRGSDTEDRIWLTEHPCVYTLGQAGRLEHLLAPIGPAADAGSARDPIGTRRILTLPDGRPVPLIRVDRGGQVTYHGPGQVIAYTLVDLRRRGWGVKRLVHTLEQAVIDLLGDYGIRAAARPDAPGVYVAGAKIASLGLRVRRGCAYHGVSLNVAMDLGPFACIEACGLKQLRVTQLAELGGPDNPRQVAEALGRHLANRLDSRREQHLSVGPRPPTAGARRAPASAQSASGPP